VGSVMDNRNQQVRRQSCRQLLLGDSSCRDAFEERRGDQNNTYATLRKPRIDFTEEDRAEQYILLTEPNSDALGFEEVMKFFGRVLSVVPGMTKKNVSKIRQRRTPFNALTYRGE